jgi:hypothetical protein
MTYLKVLWKHSFPDEPRWLYSQLDDQRWERRKIDIFPDGRWGFADEHQEVGGTGLGELATPTIEDLNADPEFEAVEISREEFEALWAARRQAVVMTEFPIEPQEALDASFRFVEAIFGPLEPEAGLPLDEITAAEARLGLSLPQGLRELYRRTGRMSSLHAAHNTLVPPEELELADGHLTFYWENQGVVAWAVARTRLAEADPPVEQGQPPHGGTESWAFYPEFTSFSEFVRSQSAWQAVQGGLPFVGVKSAFAPPGSLTVALGAPALHGIGLLAWLVDAGVVVDTGDGFVGLATRSAEAFRAASARIGIEVARWDYSTLEDR